MYALGCQWRGIDAGKGFMWFRKSAELGDVYALNTVGGALARGDGVRRDKAEAVRWFRKAAELGDAVAMRNIGLLLEKGDEEDRAEAMHWFHEAAESA
jgi:TPR repeat protein